MKKAKSELIAAILLEAVYTRDKTACERFGITDRTLRNYRQRMATDPEISAFFRIKKKAFDEAWAEQLPLTLRQSIQTVAEMCRAIGDDPVMRKNPFALEKVAAAMKVCAEVYYTGKVIDHRLGNTGEVGAGGEASDDPHGTAWTN